MKLDEKKLRIIKSFNEQYSEGIPQIKNLRKYGSLAIYIKELSDSAYLITKTKRCYTSFTRLKSKLAAEDLDKIELSIKAAIDILEVQLSRCELLTELMPLSSNKRLLKFMLSDVAVRKAILELEAKPSPWYDYAEKFVELENKSKSLVKDAWIIALVAVGVGILGLGGVVAILLGHGLI